MRFSTRNNFSVRLGDSSKLSAADPADNELLVSNTARYGRMQSGRRRPNENQFEKTNPSESIEGLPQILTSMSGSDSQQRAESIRELERLMLKFPQDVKPRVVTVFDHMIQRLSDSNSKVVTVVLSTLIKVIGSFQDVWKDQIESVLPPLISALASNLAASNGQIRTLSSEVFDRLIHDVDNMLLLQPFLSVVDYGNQRVKGPMLEKLAAITPQLAQTKPMLVTRQILPLAFRLLDEFKVDVRQNNTKLLQELHRSLGPVMLECAEKLPKHKLKKLQEILRIQEADLLSASGTFDDATRFAGLAQTSGCVA
jgi:hypothetical protein